MALLNPPQVLPNVAFIAFRAVLRSGEVGLDDLVRLISHPGAEKSQVVELTVRGGREIGLFEMDDNQVVTLGSQLAGLKPEPDVRLERASFRRAAIGLVLGPAANDYPSDTEGGATDFVRGLCWYLLQNPSDAPARFSDSGGKRGAATLKASQLGEHDDAVLRNDTRWGSFARWSTYLGFCRGHSQGIVPEPTPVVRDAILSDVLEPGTMAITEAIGQLSVALPVLDHGRYWTEMTKLVTPDIVPKRGEISATLSQSLLRLNDSGHIKLTRRSDADLVSFRLENDRSVQFSHVEKPL